MKIAIIMAGDWSACYLDGRVWFWDESKDFTWPSEAFDLLRRVREAGGTIDELSLFDLDRAFPERWKQGVPQSQDEAMADFALEGDENPRKLPVAVAYRY